MDTRTSAVARLPHLINGTLDLSEVLTRALQQAQMLTGAERAFALLPCPAGQLRCQAALGTPCTAWATPRFAFARHLAAQVATEQRARLTSDAQVDQRTDLARSMGIQSILCVPLVGSEQSLGALYVERRLTQGVFTADDLDRLETVALYTAIGIENARRYGSAVEASRREGASQMAESMVLALLPQHPPQLPGFDVAARWQSAPELSADFYDFFPLPERDRWGLVVADVSERGPPAVLFMALTRSILRGSATAAPGPLAGIRQANRLIHADAHPGRYVLAFYGELDAGGNCHYINMGYPPPLWWCARTASVAALPREREALGSVAEVAPRERYVHLEAGDVLLFWSDGLAEVCNAQGTPLGEERLIHLLQREARQPAATIAAAILEEVRLWMRGPLPHDDLLLVVVKSLPSATADGSATPATA